MIKQQEAYQFSQRVALNNILINFRWLDSCAAGLMENGTGRSLSQPQI
jgi:hypothetical protein